MVTCYLCEIKNPLLFCKIGFLLPTLLSGLALLSPQASAMSWSGDPGPWGPGPMNDAVNSWNTYAYYGFNMPVYYNAGIPTAQANYRGSIGFGGQGNYRVAMHESAHWLGTGSVVEWDAHQRFSTWNGTYATNLRRAYDGPGERQFIYGAHYGPDGANYDTEGVNAPRFIGLIGAFRRDMDLEFGDQTIGIASGTYRLRNRVAVKMLDSLGATVSGSIVSQNENSISNGQQWQISLIEGTQHFTIRSVANGLYLDSQGAATNGSLVALTSLSGAPTDNQLWEIIPTDSFFFNLVNKANGKGLDNLGDVTDGAEVAQWDHNPSWNQQWTFAHSLVQKSAPVGVISQGRPVTSSSTEGNNFDSKGNNGVSGDRWTAVDGTFPQWWRVDTGAVQAITKVEIDWFPNDGRTYQYQIEVSNDDVNWIVAANRTSNTVNGMTVDHLTGVSARFARVKVTGSSNGWAAFNECRVYNEATPLVNRSQFRPTSASSQQTGNLAVNANDVDPVFTRWGANTSTFPQWWQVDLGSIQPVRRAVIAWFDDGARSYKYRVEGSTDGVNFTTLADRSGNTTPYTTSDDFTGNARYVRITVTGSSTGWASFYDAQIFAAATLPPSNLTGLLSSDRIDLTWTASLGATSYTVNRALTPNGPYTTIATGLASTSYTDSNLTESTSHCYVVTAVVNGSESGPSAEVCLATPGTVAFWDFEDGVAGQFFTPSGSANGTGGSIDSANGILMRGWDTTAGPTWTSSVSPNGGSLAMGNADNHQDGYVTEGALHNWAPTAWTIEFTVYLEELNGWETLIGRDGSSATEAGSDFYFQNNGIDDKFRINFLTAGGLRWNLDGNYTVQTNTWYALAARSDGATLTLLLDDGSGYQQVGSLDISSQTPAQNAFPNSALNWTFGRGWYGGSFVDHIDGRMDNIRFTNGALSTAQLIPLSPSSSIEQWRLTHFGTTENTGPSADSADPDFDGVSNFDEFIAGTIPTNPSSALKITAIQTSPSLTITFPSVIGRTYRVESNPDLTEGNWSTVQTLPGTGSDLQTTDPSAIPPSTNFYRVVVFLSAP
ncbi:discoidin domain-containing protein [Akkermansiaceae bacterium]|nr:discoidin domain-containing protein [Akkermansiaceae bacterium]